MQLGSREKHMDKLLQPGILTALYEENLHGFAIIQKLSANAMFEGATPDKAGVYRYLKKMEESGLLESQWDINEEGGVPKRIYAITDEGRAKFAEWKEALKEYKASVGKLIKEMERVQKKQGDI